MNPILKRRAGIAGILAVTLTAAAVYAQTKAADGLPKVGQPAPAYSLQDGAGKTHSLSADKGHPVLIAFYPADFTGGCTMEAHSLSSSYADLKKLGVTVYGVSVQDAKSHAEFCSKEGITYPLLADTKFSMARAYGVLIPGANVANRVTFLIGADGKIAYVDSNVNGHLMTAGPDWVAWVKAHPQVKSARSADADSVPQSDIPPAVVRGTTYLPLQITVKYYGASGGPVAGGKANADAPPSCSVGVTYSPSPCWGE